jgi:thiosulfate reductase cytochrome b subunit
MMIFRHRLVTRLTHWVTALAVFVLLMSGMQIFNAYPRLHWGHFGSSHDAAWLELARFPGWATIPGFQDLATGRRWHFFFAWVLALSLAVYWLAGLANGHVRRDLSPTRKELGVRHLLQDIWDHARLRFPKGEAATRYNILQKLAYLGVVVVALPLVVFTGLTMSPGINAAMPWLVDLFGGRQSARSLHFIAAAAIALFILVHLAMVVLAGPWNEIRSMVTGRYRIDPEARP